MIRPYFDVSKEEDNSGFGIEVEITSRWSHFGFWIRKRAVNIYTGELADDLRKIDAEIEEWLKEKGNDGSHSH